MTANERERIAVLETQVASLNTQVGDMNAKLDSLLALRNKGVGAFWLASALTGTGIIGALSLLWDWLNR